MLFTDSSSSVKDLNVWVTQNQNWER